MEISVDFADGRIREFNTGSFTASDPFSGADPSDVTRSCFVTEFDLRLDLIDTEGIRLDIYYDTLSLEPGAGATLGDDPGRAEGVSAQIAERRAHGSVYLVSREELLHASYIMVRRCGQVVAVAWRQGTGNWLINGQKFSRVAREIYSDAQVTSLNAQLVGMVGALRAMRPETPEAELVEMTGYPYDAWQEISAQVELADMGEEGLFDPGDEFEEDE